MKSMALSYVPASEDREAPEQTCDICGKPGFCRDVQGTPVCATCCGPAPEPITRAEVGRALSALDKTSLAALVVMAGIGVFWLTRLVWD